MKRRYLSLLVVLALSINLILPMTAIGAGIETEINTQSESETDAETNIETNIETN